MAAIKVKNPRATEGSNVENENVIPTADYTPSPRIEQMTTLILGLSGTLSQMFADDYEAQTQKQGPPPIPAEPKKIYYTADEIGELTSLSPALIQQWGREGLIRRNQIGVKYQRYRLDEVMEDLELLASRKANVKELANTLKPWVDIAIDKTEQPEQKKRAVSAIKTLLRDPKREWEVTYLIHHGGSVLGRKRLAWLQKQHENGSEAQK